MPEIIDKIKNLANELGFSLFGIADAVPLSEEIVHYKKWIDNGLHASMKWMERNIEKRYDIRNVLPNAQSVIVLAYNYYTKFHHQKRINELSGKISKYAWGDDYHDILLPKLNAISKMISDCSDAAVNKCYVDTGPILEKQWAVKAGIGWIGKNGMLITKEYGSWVFLSVIITTVKLPVNTPSKNFCGNCNNCIDACPTNAIVADYIIDSRKCLSYWTIEAKPEITFPNQIASNTNNWIFGCDTCQDVCPWNRFQKPTEDTNFFPRNDETMLKYNNINNMSKKDFSTRFRKSPIKRTKLEGLLRNFKCL